MVKKMKKNDSESKGGSGLRKWVTYVPYIKLISSRELTSGYGFLVNTVYFTAFKCCNARYYSKLRTFYYHAYA